MLDFLQICAQALLRKDQTYYSNVAWTLSSWKLCKARLHAARLELSDEISDWTCDSLQLGLWGNGGRTGWHMLSILNIRWIPRIPPFIQDCTPFFAQIFCITPARWHCESEGQVRTACRKFLPSDLIKVSMLMKGDAWALCRNMTLSPSKGASSQCCIRARWMQIRTIGLYCTHLIWAANWAKTDRPFSMSFNGTSSSYTVSSKVVCAFWQAPNSAPMLSRNFTISWLLYFCKQSNMSKSKTEVQYRLLTSISSLLAQDDQSIIRFCSEMVISNTDAHQFLSLW